MKPHRVSDLLTALYQRTNPSYGPGRQKNEWMEVLESVGIRPEHGNRGEELESMVLVDQQELEGLRADVERLKAAPVVAPGPTDEEIWYEWCRLHRGIEGDPDEDAFSSFEEGVKQGYALLVSRLRPIGPGGVVS